MSNRIKIRAHSSYKLSVVALSIMSAMMTQPLFAAEVDLDTIVITGEKMDKTLKDTITAVTVMTSDELETGETKQAKDIATQAPNVIPGSFGNINIRGISGGGAATGGLALITGSRARVATVVDGMSQDWSGYNFSPIGLWDAQQVEVLRGPQSTAQGASAIAGALVINTNDPTFENDAAVQVGLESYKNGNLKYNLAAMTSGAIMEDELAYRIAMDETKGEGWLNYDTNGYDDTPNLSESESLNIRGKLLWQPASLPELSAKLTVNHHKNKGEHIRFASNTEEGIDSQTLTLGSGTISRQQDSTDKSIALDVDYQLKSGLTNSLHVSHSNSDLYADGYSVATATNTYDIQQDTSSLENRLIFNDQESNWAGVLGLYASSKDSVIDATQGILNIDTRYTTNTTAAYGETTYALSNLTQASLGLRIEHEDVDKTGSFFGRSDVNQDLDQTHYLPKIGLTHAMSDSTTLGASIRKGYSPSGTGINTSTNEAYEFDSETVTAYEVSSKSVFDNGTRISANLFYNDYTDYQAASGFTVVNVEAAHTYGVELETSTWLTNDVELHGSIGLLRTEIDKNDGNKGNQLSGAPETNIGLGFTQYVGDNWSFGGDANYVGQYYSTLDNSADSEVGNHTVFDARAQYLLGDLTITGYVKNLTNEDLVYYREGTVATVGQTRTIGISALYHL
ncbi:TonB-dependent receptor [Marinomonas posidonica]|uniref:TonB-dependent receptor n=1 Tax=Marinomonas posidonica (strain CECT 7376 / NCIMB 14433 / IVIA-Po-181) TaxID=491952 RepID=F6CX22_MARPP|nr:TonB-dependent receptor [Marinomonas posidonica]AEF53276.1 TonB-dependent receptor [Marinomonas posidonica IVIA-Po-181]